MIPEQLDSLKAHFSGENLEQAVTFVQNNKHNQVTSTYYLLMKKKERQTGKNYVFEQVTFEKRKNFGSTSQITYNQSGKADVLMNTTMYSQSESRSKGVPESVMTNTVMNPRRIQDYLHKAGASPGQKASSLPSTTKAGSIRNQSSPHATQ